MNNKTLALLSLLLITPSAQASISIHTFVPSHNTTFITVQDARLSDADSVSTKSTNKTSFDSQRLYFGASYEYLHEPLVAYNAQRTSSSAVISALHTLDLSVGYFFDRKEAVFVDLPLNLIKPAQDTNSFATGDTRLQGTFRLSPDLAKLAISACPEIWLPTGDHGFWLSNGSFGLGALFGFERDFAPIRAAAHIGYRFRPGATAGSIDYTHQLPMALGAAYPFHPRWLANLEASGSISLNSSRYNNPSELYLGARYKISPEAFLTGGLGLGAIAASDASGDVRMQIGIKFVPGLKN